MKTTPFAALALAVLAAGCSSLTPSAQTQMRIQEKATVYNTLTPRQQGDILGGAIERGNTTDMVFMSLGKPQKIVTSADGKKAMWVYVEYYLPKGAASLQPNAAGAANHYQPGVVAANTPFAGDPNATPAWQQPQNFMNPSGVGPVQSLSLPDLHAKTVYVFFFSGKVVEIKLDGDSSDQTSAAPNVAPAKRSAIPAPDHHV